MPLLEIRQLTKRFKSTLALDRVNVQLDGGEVLALFGENGAGKSTFVKVVSGVLPPDEGQVLVDGRVVKPGAPAAALALGIAAVHQEPHLLPQLTVAENLLVGREPRSRLGFIDASGARAEAERIAHAYALAVDVTTPIGALRGPQRRKVELVRVLGRDAQFLLLDEPTEPLGGDDRAWFGRLVDALRAEGKGVLLVSHRLRETLAMADRVAVLRRGTMVAEYRAGAVDEAAVVAAITGRSTAEIGADPARREPCSPRQPPAGAALLSVKGLTVRDRFAGVSFDVAAGEVVGLAGEPGDGRSDLLQALVGRSRRTPSGIIAIGGAPQRIASPVDAIRHGMGLVTQRRKARGLVLEMNLDRLSVLGDMGGIAASWFTGGRERDNEALEVAMKDLGTPASNASGLVKWLGAQAKVVLLDEPLRGAGPGARQAVSDVVRAMAERGCGVVISSESRNDLWSTCTRMVLWDAERRSTRRA